MNNIKTSPQLNFNHKKKPYLLITLSTSQILDIVDSMIMTLYNTIRIMGGKYFLIFAVDSCIGYALDFIRKISINEGYIIAKCGASIYDIGKKETIRVSNLPNLKVLQILRQVAIDFDLVVFAGQKEAFVFGIDQSFMKKIVLNSFESYINSYDYSQAIKFIRTHKIPSIQIFFNYFDDETLNERQTKIDKVVKENDLMMTKMSDGSFLITDIKIGECMDIILKNEGDENAPYFVLSLSDIFKENHMISTKNFYNSKISIDDLYKNKTYDLFNTELKKTINQNKLLK